MLQNAEEGVSPAEVERSIIKYKPYDRKAAVKSTNKVVPKARIVQLETQVRPCSITPDAFT